MTRLYRVIVVALAWAVVAGSSPAAGAEAVGTFGDLQEARKKAEARLAEARAANDPNGEARAELLLGLVEIAGSNGAAARTRFTDAARRFAESDDLLGTWLASIALGNLETMYGRAEEAVAAQRAAVQALDRLALPGSKFSLGALTEAGEFFGGATLPPVIGDLPPELLRGPMLMLLQPMTLDALGAALLANDDLEGAEAALTKARELSRWSGGMFEMTIAANFGDLHLRRREWAEARREYTSALNAAGVSTLLPVIGEGATDVVRLRILSNLAEVEMLAGLTEAALAWNDRALEIVRAGGRRAAEADLVRARGTLLYRARRYDAAKSAYDRALKLADEAQSPSLRGTILIESAMVDFIRGNYGAAVSSLEEGLALVESDTDRAGASIVLGQLYSTMDMSRHARSALEAAKEYAGRSEFPAIGRMADLTLVLDRFTHGDATHAEMVDAIRSFRTAKDLRSLLPHDDQMPDFEKVLGANLTMDPELLRQSMQAEYGMIGDAVAAVMEGRNLLLAGRTRDARDRLQQAIGSNSNRDYASGLHALIALSWAQEGNTECALEAFSAAASLHERAVEDIRVEEMLAGYLGSDRGVYFDILIDALAGAGRIETAFEVSERARARGLLQLLGNARLSARAEVDPALVEEAEALRAEIAARALGSGVRGGAGDPRDRYEFLLTRIKASSGEYAAMTTVQPLSIADVRRDLPPDATLITYFATRQVLHAWIVDHSTVRRVELPRDAVTIAGCWAETFQASGRGAGPPGGPSRCSEAPADEDVYAAIFEPLREHVRNRRLLIVPHGSLHRVPFAALRNPATGRRLLQDYTIGHLPSASALPFLRAKETPVSGRALVVGPPDGDEASALPHAEREAMQVAEAFGTEPLLGSDAAESSVYALAREADLVHVAAHGEFSGTHPLFSRIQLAPGDGRDGNLEVHEILSELDLRGVNLVVLAACESGLGQASGGDDVVSLTRALFYAGTPGVIATLWRIPDDAAEVLVGELYCRLRAGDSVADALRFAQLVTMSDDRFGDPAQWAAFGLYGDPLGRWGEPGGGSTRSPHAAQKRAPGASGL